GAPLRKCGGVPLGRRRQRVLQGEADGRLQRRDEALDEGSGLLSAGLGGDPELAVEGLHIQVHGHGTTLAPSMVPCHPHLGARASSASRGHGKMPACRLTSPCCAGSTSAAATESRWPT